MKSALPTDKAKLTKGTDKSTASPTVGRLMPTKCATDQMCNRPNAKQNYKNILLYYNDESNNKK